MKFMGGDQKMATNVPLSWTTEEDTTLIHYCNKITDDSIAIDPPHFPVGSLWICLKYIFHNELGRRTH